MTAKTREGFFYALLAYGWWGLVPIYFHALDGVDALEILAQRILWSLVLLVLLLTWMRRWEDLRTAFRTPYVRGMLFFSAFLVGGNWYLYIFAVSTKQIMQGSLGYFINPLINVLLGMIFFRETLRPLQWLAVFAAGAGVLHMSIAASEFPSLALALGVSFGFYGMLRKMTPVDGLIGLSVETVFLLPLAAGYLFYLDSTSGMALGGGDWQRNLLLLGSGVVTAVPLLCFGQATQRLPLSTLGFMQYLSPTIQLLVAVLIFDEVFDHSRLLSFGMIWIGLVVFTFDSIAHFRASAAKAADPATKTD